MWDGKGGRQMDPLSTMKILREMGKMKEVAHVTTFKCYRDIRGVGLKEVTVEILDHGPEVGVTRYICNATTEDGTTATGNGADSIDTAIAIVHWGDLDRKES